MKVLDGPEVFGFTTFCDDIRQEASGKLVLVGVYPDKMIVHGDFPCLLPRFAMLASCVQRHKAVALITKFVVFLPGEEDDGSPSIELPYGAEAQASAIEKSKQAPAEHGIFRAYAHIVLTPVVFQKPGLVKVRAVINDETMIRCGALPIERAPEAPTPN